MAFHLPAYTHLQKLSRAMFHKHKKYKLTVWLIQILILMIKMTGKRKWMSWLGCTRQCKKNEKQHHIQNQSKFLPWCLINGLECTVHEYFNILEYLVWTSHEIKKIRWNISKTCSWKKKSYHHWNTSPSSKRFWRWKF